MDSNKDLNENEPSPGLNILGPDILDEENQQYSGLNISDVYDAITRADPTFGEGVIDKDQGQEANTSEMYTQGMNSSIQQPKKIPQFKEEPRVVILEQPASNRFRYACESPGGGPIYGEHSTPDLKTYPTIKVVGFKGKAVVIASCVNAKDYRPHPHNLIRKDSGQFGICKMDLDPVTMTATFTHLGIQCCKRRDIKKSIQTRKTQRIDPFKTGYDTTEIDLNSVRLCFQVFLSLEGQEEPYPLKPVVSEVIFDKKSKNDLVITKLSTFSGPADGSMEMILLCEKVTSQDIQVVFLEMENDRIVWEASPQKIYVHKQFAIVFHAPPYRDTEIDNPVNVLIQLRKIKDPNETSDMMPFEFRPSQSVPHSDSQYMRLTDDNIPIKLEPREPTPATSYMADPTPSTSFVTSHMVADPHTYRVPQMTPSPQNYGPTSPQNVASPYYVASPCDLMQKPQTYQYATPQQEYVDPRLVYSNQMQEHVVYNIPPEAGCQAVDGGNAWPAQNTNESQQNSSLSLVEPADFRLTPEMINEMMLGNCTESLSDTLNKLTAS